MYICKNTSCALAISKAAFPVAMNCPVCQQALIEVIERIELSEEDELLVSNLPYVIAYPLKRTLLEKHAWTKINLFKDTFLNYLKYLGLLSASEFFNSEIKDKGMVALFHKNLMETAFGKWNHYIRECLAFLKQQNHTFFYPELVAYYELVETGNKSKKYKGEIEYQDANGDTQIIVQTSITSIGMLINFRNRYLGHGQTLDEVKSKELWNEYFPIFRHLLEQLSFTKDYPMLKREHGETYRLHTAEMTAVESNIVSDSNIWIQNKQGLSFDILPFFIVPGEVSLAKEDKEQLLTYESYTGKTIKFFSPEGTEKQTSGKILEKLNLLLRDKQKETPFSPDAFTKEEFLKRIAEENKLLLDTLISEKKIIPGIYQHREEMEIKLREWIGARANIFFIVAEAGSGKTNLLAEIQRQYTERQLPSLLIRAGRMEKQSLKQRIYYLLNLDFEKGIENYTSIAGNQAEPTFILIDGLNEANNAEEIWQEIIDLSKVFEPGSLKFVVTNRANSKTDLERYIVSELENNFLYGENKDNEKGLSAYSFWLTALDMKEMKGAWGNYVAKDKAKFKPQFNFDDIADFDRAIYNQINNPLILRLFLEIYNGKALPKKGAKHLNIWHDWLKTFSTEEQLFLKLVANEVWQKGENELLLDDLLKHEILKPYFTSDIINAPYNLLKSKGWISSYVKGLSRYVGFTVEGALLYLLALKLQEQKPIIDLAAMQSLFKSGSKLQKSAIESFLCEQALNGDLNLVADLIDAGNEYINISIKPLLLYLKTFGIELTVKKVLENPTENDWICLEKLIEKLKLYDLGSHLKELVLFLFEMLKEKKIANSKSFDIVLSNLELFNSRKQSEVVLYFSNLDIPYTVQTNIAISKYYYQIEAYLQARQILDDDIIEIKKIDQKNLYELLRQRYYCNTKLYLLNKKEGKKYINESEYLQDFLKKSILKTNNENGLAQVYEDMGYFYSIQDDFGEAEYYYDLCKDIRLKMLGGKHSLMADLNLKYAYIFKKDDFDRAEKLYLEVIEIRENTKGFFHNHTATAYFNYAELLLKHKKYPKAFAYYEKCFKIREVTHSENHKDYVLCCFKLGSCLEKMGETNKAIEYFNRSKNN